ncbi:hypothetical protein C8R46DRAFT_1219288 [Mycena filopes]|nr:hypothetical protein C8R46DRAFT_1219288 [Mycena filopes]
MQIHDVSMPLNGSATRSGPDSGPGSGADSGLSEHSGSSSAPAPPTPTPSGGQKRSLADSDGHCDAPHKVIVRGVHEGQAKKDIESLEESNHRLKQRLELVEASLAQSKTSFEQLKTALRLEAAQRNVIDPPASQAGVTTVEEVSAQVVRLIQENVALEKTCDRLKRSWQSALTVLGCLEGTNTSLLGANTTLLQLVRQLNQEEL